MSLVNFLRALGINLIALLLFGTALAGNHPALKLVQSIPLPEIDGRIDHFAVDVVGKRAFLAALTKNTIEIIDLKAGRVTRTLTGFPKPQGVRFVPELQRLYIATGLDGALTTLDASTLSVLRTAHVSLGADAIGYDPQSKYLYVGSGGSDANKLTGDLTVFSATDGAQAAALLTDAHAGGSVVEAHGQSLYVLVPEKAQVLVLDRKTRAQLAKWTVPGIQKNVALDLDETNHRLFLGVRAPASIAVLDSTTGAVVASIPTVGTLDGLSYDAATRRIYTTGGQGFIDVTQQTGADQYERIARIETAPNARTSAFVPEWHRLYVAVPREKDRGAELRAYETVP